MLSKRVDRLRSWCRPNKRVGGILKTSYNNIFDFGKKKAVAFECPELNKTEG